MCRSCGFSMPHFGRLIRLPAPSPDAGASFAARCRDDLARLPRHETPRTSVGLTLRSNRRRISAADLSPARRAPSAASASCDSAIVSTAASSSSLIEARVREELG